MHWEADNKAGRNCTHQELRVGRGDWMYQLARPGFSSAFFETIPPCQVSLVQESREAAWEHCHAVPQGAKSDLGVVGIQVFLLLAQEAAMPRIETLGIPQLPETFPRLDKASVRYLSLAPADGRRDRVEVKSAEESMFGVQRSLPFEQLKMMLLVLGKAHLSFGSEVVRLWGNPSQTADRRTFLARDFPALLCLSCWTSGIWHMPAPEYEDR